MLPEIDMAYSFFTQLYGLNLLVTILSWETANFDDEICSRHHFGVRNGQFWRRDWFSSSF
ncbi:hypothetical protein P5F75_14655 [Caldifermentibacillus hisashii]|uniref:hypothetical protein n=1 Tax=Caldifermentibacillus hisashii TaxID=996558 RepID=UPI002E1B685A|nr:hypothetical protein [Caldifermentibacillus hisashii]